MPHSGVGVLHCDETGVSLREVSVGVVDVAASNSVAVFRFVGGAFNSQAEHSSRVASRA